MRGIAPGACHARGNDNQGYFADHIKMTRHSSLVKLGHCRPPGSAQTCHVPATFSRV